MSDKLVYLNFLPFQTIPLLRAHWISTLKEDGRQITLHFREFRLLRPCGSTKTKPQKSSFLFKDYLVVKIFILINHTQYLGSGVRAKLRGLRKSCRPFVPVLPFRLTDQPPRLSGHDQCWNWAKVGTAGFSVCILGGPRT